MDEQLAELFANLPAYLGGHMLLSTLSLWAGLGLSLPLGIAASRRPVVAEWVLTIAGILQTVPSLALLGLAVLVLGGMIGFVPAFLVLVLYSILPILANTILGIRGVDPSLTEAARGLGMNNWQMLRRVELPLAAPVILGGVRTATVLVVGTATLATPVGALSLGNYIFAGLATLNHLATVFGCVAAALLAILLDQLIRLLEVAARRRSRPLLWIAALGLFLVTVLGLYNPIARWLHGGNRVVIATQTFSEQYVLSHALSHHLETAGFQPDRRDGMSLGIVMEALRRGQVDCVVTYTGDVWAVLMKRSDVVPPAQALEEVRRFLVEDYGVAYLGPLGFENAYALAMTKQRAADWQVETIDQLAEYTRRRLGRPLKIAGDLMFFERREWQELKKQYGLAEENVRIVALDPSRMYDAARDGQVDVIVAYTSDGHVVEYGLDLLKDPRHVFPPYDAILVASLDAADRPGFQEALRPMLGAIPLEIMQEANRRVDVQHQPPAAAARWLLDTLKMRRSSARFEKRVP